MLSSDATTVTFDCIVLAVCINKLILILNRWHGCEGREFSKSGPSIYLDFGQAKKEKNVDVDKSVQKEEIFEKATDFGG